MAESFSEESDEKESSKQSRTAETDINLPHDHEEVSLTELETEDFFNKNTDSFKCLAQVLISRSSLLRHPLYHFPPLQDPGLDAAFNYIEPIIGPDATGCEYYVKLCKDMGIAPFKRVLKSFWTDTLDLRYYGLTEKQLRAIMITLKYNQYVKIINLQDNWLSPQSVRYISDMFEMNNRIRYINLRECRIKAEGAVHLNDGLEASLGITRLDLSCNSLGDEGLHLLEYAFLENVTITRLNLSHNNLGDGAAKVLATIFTGNHFIENLDLSWNNFYKAAGNKVLFAALSDNRSLKVLNLAWNGIRSRECVLPINKYMRNTNVLEYLDLSNNSLTGEPLKLIRLGMVKCKTLRSINLGFNLITPDEALFVLRYFTAAPDNQLEFLDMENTFVKKDFLPLLAIVEAQGKGVLIGGVLGNYKIRGPDYTKLLFERARFLAKKSKKDFGHFILQMPEEDIPKQDFQKLVENFKMKKVDKDLVAQIMNKFPAKKQNIGVVEMKETYMRYYPDTVLPPPKKKAGKKGKKGKAKAKRKGQPSPEVVEGLPQGEGQPPIEGQTAEEQPPTEGQPPIEGQPSPEEPKRNESQQNTETQIAPG